MIRTKRAARIAKAAVLLTQPNTTAVAVAKQMGISRTTLYRDLEIANQDSAAKDLLAQRVKLRELIPTDRRAGRYSELVDSDNPFASLRALERVEALIGIHAEPPKEASQHAEPVPLFSLPPGTRVAIQVGKPD